jgi:hypothetical protein
MAGVFISDAREERETARQLAQVIEQNGYPVWRDRELVAGNQFADVIEGKLDSADAVTVLWSEQSQKSYWVRDKAAVGQDRNRLIPSALDEVTPPLGFRQLHTPSSSSWSRASDRRLNSLWLSLAGLTGRQPQAAAPPPPAQQPPRRQIVAGVNVAPNSKAIGDILKGDKRQRSFLQTFWLTSLVVSLALGMLSATIRTAMGTELGGNWLFVSLTDSMIAGVILIFGRFLAVVGRRLSKRKSIKYFDQPTLIMMGLSALCTWGGTLAQPAGFQDHDILPVVFVMFFSMVALVSVPIGFCKGLGRKTFEDGQ